jgi:ATP synthase protein I
MDKNKSDLLKSLGMVSSMGISVVVAIVIGIVVGRQLDNWFGTAPWFFFIFLFFGIAAGFRNIYIITQREIHRDENGKN